MIHKLILQLILVDFSECASECVCMSAPVMYVCM